MGAVDGIERHGALLLEQRGELRRRPARRSVAIVLGAGARARGECAQRDRLAHRGSRATRRMSVL